MPKPKTAPTKQGVRRAAPELRLHWELPRIGRGPGVLVIHSWWGFTPSVVDYCRQLAKHGFVAAACDLFDGSTASTEAQARRLRAAKRREPMYKTLMRAIDALTRNPATTTPKIGLVGFSMGGHWTVWLSQRPDLPVAAAVLYYAARAGDFRKSRAAFLVHRAENDPCVSPNAAQRMRKAIVAAGRPCEEHLYSGTGHWFAESARRDDYVAAAAALALRRTVEFLGCLASP